MEEIIRNLLQLLMNKYTIIYFLIINLLGFLAFGIDKYKAQKGYWRIPESTLLMFCVLGGGIGTILGMNIFRHKTKKLRFSVGMPTVLILEIIAIAYLIIKYLIV